MSAITDAAKEAVAIAKGDQPAARITVHGHTYVPLAVAQYESDCVEAAKAEIERLQIFLREIAAMGPADEEWDADTLGDAVALAKRALDGTHR